MTGLVGLPHPAPRRLYLFSPFIWFRRATHGYALLLFLCTCLYTYLSYLQRPSPHFDSSVQHLCFLPAFTPLHDYLLVHITLPVTVVSICWLVWPFAAVGADGRSDRSTLLLHSRFPYCAVPLYGSTHTFGHTCFTHVTFCRTFICGPFSILFYCSSLIGLLWQRYGHSVTRICCWALPTLPITVHLNGLHYYTHYGCGNRP